MRICVSVQRRHSRSRMVSERDPRLLRLQDEDRLDDWFVLFNLGSVCRELGRLAEALAFLEASL